MKKISKAFLSFFIISMSFIFISCFVSPAALAAKNPPQVKNLKAEVGSTTTNLTWNRINSAKYVIYTYNPSNKKYTKVNTTANNTYTVKGLKQGTTFRFCVQAYKTSNQKNYYGKKSEIIKVTTLVTNPSQVKNLKATSTDSSVKLSWNKVNGAKYAVYSYNPSNKKYTHLGNTGSTSCTIKKNIKPSTTYRYAVRAFKTVNGKNYYGKYSSVI